MSGRLLTLNGLVHRIVLKRERVHDSPHSEHQEEWAARRYISDFYSNIQNRNTLCSFLRQEFHVAVEGLSNSRVLDYLASFLADGSYQVIPLSPDPLSSTHPGLGKGKGSSPPAEKKKPPPVPKKPKKKPDERVTVVIRAENGTDPAPRCVGIKTETKLKAVPSKGSGSYSWSTTSTRIELDNTSAQTVTVKAKDKVTPSGSEEIKLVFTPSGKGALPPVKHNLKLATVNFIREPSHPWGYDAYETTKYRDKDGNRSEPSPEPKHDYVSIKKSQVGKVKVKLNGLPPAEVFFKSQDDGICKPKETQPNADPFVLELEAESKDKDETIIEARLGSASGPVVAKIGAVVLKEVTYRVELFRVKDSSSAGTALNNSVTGAQVKTYLNNEYKQAVAKFAVAGGSSEKDVAYDSIANGALDMEPGTTSAEQQAVITACTSTKQKVVHVHDLRWAFYLTADAAATDNKIKLKTYAALKYLGTKAYKIEDKNGHKKTVTITAVNKTTGEITLSGPIGQAFKVSDKAALIFPLAGLSGNPVWVKDMSSADKLKMVIAHELGHSCSNLRDLCEIKNLMHGMAAPGTTLRQRGIAQYYAPGTKEKQWTKMTR